MMGAAATDYRGPERLDHFGAAASRIGAARRARFVRRGRREFSE